jgi:hypothetical protein
MANVAEICARLLAARTLSRREIPELDHGSIRADVEARLAQVGLGLATSAYSDHVGLRLLDASALPTASNMGLSVDACALLTILWMRLALPYRTANDGGQTSAAQQALLPSERRAEARAERPTVSFETLLKEFGAQLHGQVRLKGLIGQLRHLGFVQYSRLDTIEAGPLLELAVDGEEMARFVRTEVFKRHVEAATQDGSPKAPRVTIDDKVLAGLDPSRPMKLRELEKALKIPRMTIRDAIGRLKRAGRVEQTGQGPQAAYRRAEAAA